jgi:hypothetical protein
VRALVLIGCYLVLGRPLATREHAPVLDAYDVDFIEVWRRDPAPRGYDADRAAAP